jgi:hypothetical protein
MKQLAFSAVRSANFGLIIGLLQGYWWNLPAIRRGSAYCNELAPSRLKCLGQFLQPGTVTLEEHGRRASLQIDDAVGPYVRLQPLIRLRAEWR